MSNQLVRITKVHNGYGEEEKSDDGSWHGVIQSLRPATVCGYDIGATTPYSFDKKEVRRGGINCHICLNLIRQIKEIKL